MLKNKVALRSLSLALTVSASLWLTSFADGSIAAIPFSTIGSTDSLLSTARFAVIGDFGTYDDAAIAVATEIGGWQPDLIVTVGDNNYPDGAASTIDKNIGWLYHSYIYPYLGTYATPTPSSTPGPARNRFWPALGNHDWTSLVNTNGTVTGPHMDYFALPGNERCYDFVEGPVHFFVIDSDQREPDGVQSTSTQAKWLKQQLTASTSPWQLILMHHSPYSSSAVHGSQSRMQWPYKEWGADAVFSGHDHVYERLEIDGLVYFVNGLGGAGRYSFSTPVSGSKVRYAENHGAMLIEATEQKITFRMINILGDLIDEKVLSQSEPASELLFLPIIQR